MKKDRLTALLPILVLLVLYIGIGILNHYDTDSDIYSNKFAITLIFLISLFVAFFQAGDLHVREKIVIMSRGVGNPNIFIMVLIFLMSGAFVGIVGRSCANSVAYCMLSAIPPQYAVGALFIISCIVSIAMGTSVGTVTLLTPIAISISEACGFSLPLCVGTVLGGAMFGDNLSFISDTTIAACSGQHVAMKDKFRENFRFALPAALVTLVIILILSVGSYSGGKISEPYQLIHIIPYVLVLVCGLLGMNIFLILAIGIVSGSILVMANDGVSLAALLSSMENGISSMFETSIIAILSAATCALINYNGGFHALLNVLRRTFKTGRGIQVSIGLLAGLLDLATANNTVAIVIANPVAKELSDSCHISGQRTASILDTFASVMQGLIPYGAQTLVILGICSSAGHYISAVDIILYSFYPLLLLLAVLFFIFLCPDHQRKAPESTAPPQA